MSELLETEIALGLWDGTYFVGVQPPLSEDEVTGLEERGTLKRELTHVVGEDPGCSMIEVDGGQDIAELRMMDVWHFLYNSRKDQESIQVYLVPVELTEAGHTPFNQE